MDYTFIPCDSLQVRPENAPQFGKRFSDYMFMMEYTTEKGWHNAVLKPYGHLQIDPSLLALHYGQTIFEGLKCYRDNDGEFVLFRPYDNMRRFNESAKRMCMPEIDVDFCVDMLVEHLKKEKRWLYEDEGSSLYIRPFMFASEHCLGVKVSDHFTYMVIISPSGPYFSGDIRLKVETEYVRAVPGGTGEAKNGGNYGGSLKAMKTANEEGFSQVLWLDGIERKYVEEAGVMNVFFKIDGKIHTPQFSGSILKGITRDSAIQGLRDLGYEVIERKISIDEVVEAYDQGLLQECFCSGTAASISPIKHLSYKGKPMDFDYLDDATCKELAKYLHEYRMGIKPDIHNWIVK